MSSDEEEAFQWAHTPWVDRRAGLRAILKEYSAFSRDSQADRRARESIVDAFLGAMDDAMSGHWHEDTPFTYLHWQQASVDENPRASDMFEAIAHELSNVSPAPHAVHGFREGLVRRNNQPPGARRYRRYFAWESGAYQYTVFTAPAGFTRDSCQWILHMSIKD